jgi:plasmid stabilization system protein ParE
MPPDFNFDPRFDKELDAITDFLIAHSLSAARAFGDDFEAAIQRVLEFPQSGARRAGGARAIRVGTGPYSIVYVAREDGRFVRFIALAHASRRPGYWRDRL